MKKMIFIVICLALSGCEGKRLPPPVKVETYTYPDGGQYVGKFKDGKKNGQGTFTYPEGQKYVGRWKDDKRNGQGTLTSPSGYKYEGEWKDGKPDGQGTETFPDGSKYVGEWKGGEMWNGTIYDKDGNIIKKVVNGKMINQ